jgi:UDP-N-acetylglucosamine:LPS N-acetylglucosamine transferase
MSPNTAPSTAPSTASGTAPSRIVIFSASVGAGHDSAAAALADRMTVRGYSVDRHDFLGLMPGGRVLCGSYKRIITRAPALYQCIYERTERNGRPGAVQRRLLRAAERAVLAAIPADTVVVVATYPLAAQVLGRLRRTGRLAIPVATLFTDFSVHPLWIADGVDLYLAATGATAALARRHGATGRVSAVGPLVDGRFGPATRAAQTAARERFGLPSADGAKLALLLGGSWGVGAIEETAADLAATGLVTPVVVCGRNEALAERLRAQGVEHVFGWVDDMPGLMAAADVMVQNAGAASTLEAFASGLPVATYRCLPGHGRANAEVLDDAGLAVWVREPGDLAGVLLELTSGLRGLRQRTAALALVAGAAGQADSALLELIGEHFRSMSGPVLAAPTLNAVKALNVAPTSPRIPAPDGLAGLPTSALLTAV